MREKGKRAETSSEAKDRIIQVQEDENRARTAADGILFFFVTLFNLLYLLHTYHTCCIHIAHMEQNKNRNKNKPMRTIKKISKSEGRGGRAAKVNESGRRVLLLDSKDVRPRAAEI